MAVVEAHHVSRRYGEHLAVDDVTVAFQPGQCTAIVGHNGAGKSTLIKMLLGLVRPTAGRITIFGEDPSAGNRRWRSQVGFLPENVSFPPSLSGRETLDFYSRLKGQSAAANGDLLDRVGLGAAAANRRVSTYSKGMRQRLGLAQALLGNPRLLVLDEPTSGLDPSSRQNFYAILRDLVADGAAVLLSSHALEEIEGQASRIAVMSQGRLMAFGSLDDLRGLSQLPVRIQLRVANGHAAALVHSLGVPATVQGHDIALSCMAAAKMDVLRRVASCDEVVDFNVQPPSLDSLYAWFMEAGR
ncbi:MAG: ABC transporter ATP-binding protein [Proteobacteria bacterium]|jgi:Cu-processing system ATP-binding protein|nr:ABC transporter ATP-binding protein [Pseudomonadota bacterium]